MQLNFFIISLGSIVNLILAVFYFRKKDKRLLIFTILMCLFLLSLILDFIPIALISNGIIESEESMQLDQNILVSAYNTVRSLIAFCYIFIVPFFANTLFNIKIEKKISKISFILISLNILLLIVVTSFQVSIVIKNWAFRFWSFSMTAAIGYCGVICLINYKNIKQKQLKRYISIITITTVAFLPFFILRDFSRIELIDRFIPNAITSRLFFYVLLNIYTIVFFFLYHFSLETRIIPEKLTEDFNKKYGISPRENEVVNLLLEGKKYEEIKDELFISMPTVKSHVYSVYKKTNCSNKSSLIRLIQKAALY